MFRILVVDDNNAFRQALHQSLARLFPDILIDEAATAADATGRALSYDLVFMDIRLPDASGLELTRWLKLTARPPRVCVVTQSAIPEYAEAARRCGADAFILKGDLTAAAIVAVVEASTTVKAS